jgi:hypothetical protein
VFDAGSEMPRPAARHSISIRHPRPSIGCPPITQSIGMKTSLPQVGPFWNTQFNGMCRLPMRTPGWVVGISAQVMPMSSLSPARWSGSYARNARPSSVATGPSVM